MIIFYQKQAESNTREYQMNKYKILTTFLGVSFLAACCNGYIPHTTFRTYRRTYFLYEVSRAYPQAIQFCRLHGHDNLAKPCDPHELTHILPTPGDRKIFWVRDPSICSHIGSCLTLWFDNTRYTNWVLKCSRCTQTWYIICEEKEPNNVTSTTSVTQLTPGNVTLGLSGNGNSTCSVVTSSKVIDSPCSDIHGTMCSVNTLKMQVSFFDSKYSGDVVCHGWRYCQQY